MRRSVKANNSRAPWLVGCFGEILIIIGIGAVAVFPPFDCALLEAIGRVYTIPLDINFRKTNDVEIVEANSFAKSGIFWMRSIFGESINIDRCKSESGGVCGMLNQVAPYCWLMLSRVIVRRENWCIDY